MFQDTDDEHWAMAPLKDESVLRRNFRTPVYDEELETKHPAVKKARELTDLLRLHIMSEMRGRVLKTREEMVPEVLLDPPLSNQRPAAPPPPASVRPPGADAMEDEEEEEEEEEEQQQPRQLHASGVYLANRVRVGASYRGSAGPSRSDVLTGTPLHVGAVANELHGLEESGEEHPLRFRHHLFGRGRRAPVPIHAPMIESPPLAMDDDQEV